MADENKATMTFPDGQVAITGDASLIGEAVGVLLKWQMDKYVDREVANGRDRAEVEAEVHKDIQEKLAQFTT